MNPPDVGFVALIYVAATLVLGAGLETLFYLNRRSKDLPADEPKPIDMAEVQRQVRLGQELLERERGRQP